MSLGRGSSARFPRASFGRFQLLGELGRGGMGVVYRAFDPQTNRNVALKTLLTETKGTDRFDREVEAMARLRHPNIVAIHETGTLLERRYFVMDLIEGQPLDTRLESSVPMERAKVVAILRDVAAAVHHAHGQGIVHRDLKPSNILLGPQDHPYVLDFGVARILDRKTQLTKTNAVIGTLAYMPPEQASGQGDPITARSDVYSLGATLYHALTGHPPFESMSGFSLVAAVIQEPPTRPRAIDPTIPRDLEAVCLRCLEKKPGDRYPTAEALAEDLGRVLDGKPIAHAPRRGRGRALAAVALALVGGLGAAWAARGRTGPGKGPSPTPAATVAAAGSRGTGTPSPRRTESPVASDLGYLRGKLREGRCLSLEAIWGRPGWAEELPIEGVAAFPGAKRALTCTRHGARLWDLETGRALRTFPLGHVLAVAPFPDGHRALASLGQKLVVIDVDSGAVESVGAVSQDEIVRHDARRLAVAADGDHALLWCDDMHVRLFSVREKRVLGATKIHRATAIPSIAVAANAPHGAFVDGPEVSFLAFRGGGLDEVGRGKLPEMDRRWKEPELVSVALTPDGGSVVAGGVDGSISEWRFGEAQTSHLASPLGVVAASRALGLTRDRHAFVVGTDARLRFMELGSGDVVRTLWFQGSVTAGSLAAGDKPRLVVGGDDRRIRVLDAEEGELDTDKGHSASVDVLVPTPDGRRVLSGSRDATLKLWDVATGHELATLVGHTGDVTGAAISLDGRRAVSVASGFCDDAELENEKRDPIVRVWDLDLREARTSARCDVPHTPCAVAWSPDGEEVLLGLAANDPGQSVVRWRPADEKWRRIDTGSRELATPSTANVLTTIPPPTGAAEPGRGVPWLALVGGDSMGVTTVGLVSSPQGSPDGDVDSELVSFAVDRGAPVSTASAIAASADGHRVAAGTSQGLLRAWDVRQDGRLSPDGATETVGHKGARVRGVALDAQGKLAASVADDGTLKLWALPGWRSLDVLDFSESRDRPRSVAFAGRSIVVGLSSGPILRYAVRAP